MARMEEGKENMTLHISRFTFHASRSCYLIRKSGRMEETEEGKEKYDASRITFYDLNMR